MPLYTYVSSGCRTRAHRSADYLAPRTTGFGHKKTPADRGFYVCSKCCVGDTGIEPVTSSVSGKRATAAPIAQDSGKYGLTSCTKNRGGYGIRTRVNGFAGRCLASRPIHQLGSYQTNWNRSCDRFQYIRADDEIRTRDPHLGKVMRYHCATSATVRISAYSETLAE